MLGCVPSPLPVLFVSSVNNNLYWKLKGLEIRKAKDCWGCDVYFGYKDGKQYTDYFDAVSELKEQYPIFNLIEVM